MDIHQRLDRLWALCFSDAASCQSGSNWPADQILTQRLLVGAEADWTEGIKHIHAGEALRAKGNYLEALAEYGLAFAHTGPSTNLLLYVVIGFASMQDVRAAETWANRLIEHSCDSADVYLHLSIAIWNSGRQDEALALCDVNIARHPKHVGSVATAAGFYMATGQPSKAFDLCLALLELSPHAFDQAPNLYKVITSAAISSDRKLPSSCLAKIESAAADLSGPIEARDALAMLKLRDVTRSAWRDFFVADRPPAPEFLAIVNHVPRSRLKQFFDDSPPPKIVSLSDAAALNDVYPGGLTRPDTLEAAGFKLAGRSKDPALPQWVGQNPLSPNSNNPISRLQHCIIAEGRVDLLSPFGDQVTSASSFVAAYRPSDRENGNVLFYYFAKPKPLFIILATEQIWPMAWYDPIADVVLMHEGAFSGGFNAYIRQSICDLRYILLHDLLAAKSYLANDSVRIGKKVTLLFGVLAYLSTHILDIEGLSLLFEKGLIGRIDSIVLTAPEPLGRIEDYFQQISSDIVHRPKLDDVIDLNAYLWQKNALCIRATGCGVGDGVAEAVLAHANLLADPAWKQKVDELAGGSDLVLFIALRAVNRKWLAKPSDIASMFNELQTDFPRLVLIFDGYCKTFDDPVATNSTIDLQYIASICEHLSASIEVIIAAGRTMNDAIYAAQASDMHLSAQGTTTTKSLLIASKPGVVFGPRQFTINFEFMRHPRPATIVLREQSVDALDGNCQTNFSLDAGIVLDSLRQLAKQILPPTRS